MPREISSSTYTAFTKLGAIVFFVVFVPIGIFASYKSLFELLIQLLIVLPIGFLAIRWAFKLRLVEANENGLIIWDSNFGTNIFVPFSNIESVTQRFWQRSNSETVTITFIEPTEFGKKIKFMPISRFFPFFEHPIVNELNLLIKDHFWRDKLSNKMKRQ